MDSSDELFEASRHVSVHYELKRDHLKCMDYEPEGSEGVMPEESVVNASYKENEKEDVECKGRVFEVALNVACSRVWEDVHFPINEILSV